MTQQRPSCPTTNHRTALCDSSITLGGGARAPRQLSQNGSLTSQKKKARLTRRYFSPPALIPPLVLHRPLLMVIDSTMVLPPPTSLIRNRHDISFFGGGAANGVPSPAASTCGRYAFFSFLYVGCSRSDCLGYISREKFKGSSAA